MNIIPLLQQRIGFTRNELVVIVFLAAALLGGIAVRRLSPGPARAGPPHFGFSRSDSEFAARTLVPPSPGTPEGPYSHPHPGPKSAPTPGSININSAGAAELMRLPGIGPAYAERILAYRAVHGRFRTIDGLAGVRGIGPKRLEKLRRFVALH